MWKILKFSNMLKLAGFLKSLISNLQSVLELVFSFKRYGCSTAQKQKLGLSHVKICNFRKNKTINPSFEAFDSKETYL